MFVLVFKLYKCPFVFLKSKKYMLVNIYLGFFFFYQCHLWASMMSFWCFCILGGLFQIYNDNSDHVSRSFGKKIELKVFDLAIW